ncbi:MAG TPA: hypothetical protein VIJ26_17430 [Thermoanaerobaculia bacterium]
MRARWPRLVPLCFALLAGASAVRAEEPAAPPRLPSGMTPLPKESASHVDELLQVAEKYRGLKALRSVPAASTSPRKLKAQIKASMPKELPAAELKALGISLKAFGLIPETMDLGRYLPELLSSQVAGFYDPDDKSMTLVDTAWAPAGKKETKEERMESEDMVLVHELTHALQDQHFNLHRFEERDPLSDGGTAKKALVEGDATLTMLDAYMKVSFEAIPGVDTIMTNMMRDPETLLAGSGSFPGAEEMRAAPAWIRDTLMFSYLQGLTFCVSAKRLGGQALLDYAFTTDPPRSSEQVLHPEKWHTKRDDPVGLRFPDLAAELPGYRKASEGEMGELGLRILFRQDLESREQADAAAAGWGGDRFAVYEKGGGRLIVWLTEWDTEADAGELRSALQSIPGWRVEAAGPTRVLAVHGGLPDEAWTKVRARLAAVTAERPANREIDLKAIGAKPAEMAPVQPPGRADPRMRTGVFDLRAVPALEDVPCPAHERGTMEEEGASTSLCFRVP